MENSKKTTQDARLLVLAISFFLLLLLAYDFCVHAKITAPGVIFNFTSKRLFEIRIFYIITLFVAFLIPR